MKLFCIIVTGFSFIFASSGADSRLSDEHQIWYGYVSSVASFQNDNGSVIPGDDDQIQRKRRLRNQQHLKQLKPDHLRIYLKNQKTMF